MVLENTMQASKGKAEAIKQLHPGAAPMKRDSDQNDKIYIRVHKWHSHFGCYLTELKVHTQQEGNHAWYWNLASFLGLVRPWTLAKNRLLLPFTRPA